MHQHQRPGLRAAGLLTAATVAVVAGCSAHATSAREGEETFVLRSDSAASNPDYR